MPSPYPSAGQEPSSASSRLPAGLPAETAARILEVLITSLRLGEPDLFADYACWLGSFGRARGVARPSLRKLLEDAARAATGIAPDEAILATLERGQLALRDLSAPAGPPLEPADPRLAAYLEALLAADRQRARQVVIDALEAGESYLGVVFDILQPAEREIGGRWLAGEIPVALEHLATATTGQLLGELYARAPRQAANGLRVLTVCAPGELHELGARIVADVLEMAGWKSLYVGANTSAEDAARLAGETQPDVLAISVTLAANLLAAMRLAHAARERVPELRVIVGGNLFASFPGLWRRLGADGSADDAREVPVLAAGLVKPTGTISP